MFYHLLVCCQYIKNMKQKKVYLIQILFIIKSVSAFELNISTYNNSLSICTLKIAERHFTDTPNINIFSINSTRDYDLLYNVYASPNFAKKLKNLITFKVDFNEIFKRYTIIAADNLYEIVINEMKINNLLLWNARSKYIFVVRQNSKEYLNQTVNLLWYNYIINAVILMPSKENETNIEIYSWFPFENGLCGKNVKARLIDTCIYGNFIENTYLYPDKVPLKLNGCPIRAQVIIAPPYVMPPNNGIIKEGEVLDITQGTEIMLMRTIAQLVNFTFLPMASTIPNNWGLATEDGNTTGTIRILYEKKAELGFGSYGPTAERRMFCDYSASHTFESATWCVPQAQLAPRWRNILDTFQYSTWLSMISTYIMVSCIIWCFCYAVPKDLSSYILLNNCLHNMFSIFFAISADKTPKKGSARIIFFVWIVFGLHFVAAYQAKLITVLLHPPYEKQMNTLDEILTSDIEWASLPTLKRFFNNTDDWRVAKIINEWKTEQSAIKGLTRIAKKRDFAFFVLENNARYESLRFVGRNSQPAIFCLPSYLLYPSEIYMTKGFPLKSHIDKYIYKMQATGFMEKWKQDVYFQLTIKNKDKINGDDNARNLTLKHLQGAFLILGMGLGCATTVYIFELIYNLIKHRTIRRKVINKWKRYKNHSAKTRAAIKSIRIVHDKNKHCT